ncbi:MAG: 4Fe-4S binding protein [Clostridia bacterium]|nr:4Fe-4S binding protein [Clostridia bacterium]
MPRIIGDSCVSCGTCEPQCPVSAISIGADKYIIAEGECINCGACEAVCPVGAISETEEE